MAGSRVRKVFRASAGVLAIAAGAFLAVRPFASVEVMALCVGAGLLASALVELVQVRRDHPAKPILAAGFALASLLVGLWQPVNLAVVGGVTGSLLVLAGGAELWSAALLGNPTWPRLLNQPSNAGFWPSLLVGGAWIVLGSIAVIWTDRTLLPKAVVLGMYLIIAGLGLIVDLWFPDHRLSRVPDRSRLAGRVVAIVLGSALAFAGIGIDQGRVAPGAFYGSVTVAGHAAGKLLRADSYTGGTAAGVIAARLLYVTTTAQGSPTVASATIYVPADHVTEQLPLVVWVHDATGLSPGCAPSVRGPAAGGMTFIEQVAQSGYALLAPDLPGLGAGGEPSYLIGQPEGRAVLDALRAARQLNGVRFGDAVLWGYGQGGHASLWAGEIRDNYAPEIALAGIATLAPFTDLTRIFAASERPASAESADAYLIDSYAEVYPEVVFADYVRPSAWLRARESAARCQDWPGPLLTWLRTLDDSPIWQRPADEGPLAARLAANSPNGRVPVPILLAQGGRDELVTRAVQDRYVADQCRRGTELDYRVYSDLDHRGLVAAGSPAIAELLSWTAERFAGVTSADNCG
jgi:Uncharacterized conserved protein